MTEVEQLRAQLAQVTQERDTLAMRLWNVASGTEGIREAAVEEAVRRLSNVKEEIIHAGLGVARHVENAIMERIGRGEVIKPHGNNTRADADVTVEVFENLDYNAMQMEVTVRLMKVSMMLPRESAAVLKHLMPPQGKRFPRRTGSATGRYTSAYTTMDFSAAEARTVQSLGLPERLIGTKADYVVIDESHQIKPYPKGKKP